MSTAIKEDSISSEQFFFKMSDTQHTQTAAPLRTRWRVLLSLFTKIVISCIIFCFLYAPVMPNGSRVDLFAHCGIFNDPTASDIDVLIARVSASIERLQTIRDTVG
jgi:hypothetical protein